MDRRKFIAMLGAAPVLTALGAEIAAKVGPSPFETVAWDKPMFGPGQSSVLDLQKQLDEMRFPAPSVEFMFGGMPLPSSVYAKLMQEKMKEFLDRHDFYMIGDDWPVLNLANVTATPPGKLTGV